MKKTDILLLIFLLVQLTACSQTTSESSAKNDDRVVGGRCEGCEAALEFGSRKLSWTDTLPDYHDNGPRLEVTGTIYKANGRTPAEGVILYVYHTDQSGIYPKRGDEQGWARQHGYIRGWIKTGADGRYKFYTLRPGAYPGRENPEHIHATIKEEGLTPYYIDDFHFDDDPIFTPEHRQRQPNRGGSGIVKVTKLPNGHQKVTRDIVLGKNIPGY